MNRGGSRRQALLQYSPMHEVTKAPKKTAVCLCTKKRKNKTVEIVSKTISKKLSRFKLFYKPQTYNPQWRKSWSVLICWLRVDRKEVLGTKGKTMRADLWKQYTQKDQGSQLHKFSCKHSLLAKIINFKAQNKRLQEIQKDLDQTKCVIWPQGIQLAISNKYHWTSQIRGN